jgi:hypothetical protein
MDARSDVTTAPPIIARLESAPVISLSLNTAAVPRACDIVPSATPRAAGSRQHTLSGQADDQAEVRPARTPTVRDVRIWRLFQHCRLPWLRTSDTLQRAGRTTTRGDPYWDQTTQGLSNSFRCHKSVAQEYSEASRSDAQQGGVSGTCRSAPCGCSALYSSSNQSPACGGIPEELRRDPGDGHAGQSGLQLW